MKRGYLLGLAISAALLGFVAGAPAVAQTAPADTAASVEQTSDAATAAGDAGTPSAETAERQNERVCKRITSTGSRLNAIRECHTRAEWDRMAAVAQDTMRRTNDAASNGAMSSAGN